MLDWAYLHTLSLSLSLSLCLNWPTALTHYSRAALVAAQEEGGGDTDERCNRPSTWLRGVFSRILAPPYGSGRD